ncbi:YqjF family protein [Kitasatospora sp. NPDC059571]|uniref:YqjF family protein n=1 Tax=Kitasatospora sp. NPDC059571 TaxID=3346871 RepID=UPI003688F521
MRTVEPLTDRPPRPARRALLGQTWRHVLFVHWPVNPAAVAPLLPRGVRPDVRNGTSWVGLVPFTMERLGPVRLGGVPYLGTFTEVNVRLYSVDAAGRRGVVFRTLACSRLLPVLAARAALRLPYRWASARLIVTGHTMAVAARDRRPGGRATTTVLTARIGPRIEHPGPLATFLTARWGLHVDWYGRTLYLPADHPPWPLHHAELTFLADRFVADAGIRVTPPAISVLYSPGVPVRFGPALPCPVPC